MRLRGITLDDFRASVARVNASTSEDGIAYSGNLAVHPDARQHGVRVPTVSGRLYVLDSRAPGARWAVSGRRMPAACWHAFRDVYRDLLQHHPDLVITTAMARYTSENFEDTFPSTADVNVGNMMQWVSMADLCNCEKDDEDKR
jgi:hypothetical protein